MISKGDDNDDDIITTQSSNIQRIIEDIGFYYQSSTKSMSELGKKIKKPEPYKNILPAPKYASNNKTPKSLYDCLPNWCKPKYKNNPKQLKTPKRSNIGNNKTFANLNINKNLHQN